MKYRLCLHGLEVKHQMQLLKLIRRLLPNSTVKYKFKEKYFSDNDMYKCRIARFISADGSKQRLYCAWGVMLVSDKLMPIADIILEFDDSCDLEIVQMQLKRLLSSRIKFVLEEPDFRQRIKQLRGCFELDELDLYDKEIAVSALYCHLPWQVYYVSKLWQEVLQRGPEKPLMRQLRVKLRRLRSLLTFCKPLLPEETAVYWQGVLKARTAMFSAVREYDVALMTCAKLKGSEAGADAVPNLTALLQKLRSEAADKALRGQKLNRVTLELGKFLLWLYSVSPQKKEQSLDEFLRRRFSVWYDKLIKMPEGYPNTNDMEQLHRIRIKLKRFRYALQSIPELKAEPRLLRNLKYLQDMLGLLHDDYINALMIERLVADNPKIPELRYEGAMFTGWERAKSDAALEALPQQWEDFCELLTEWKDKYLMK